MNEIHDSLFPKPNQAVLRISGICKWQIQLKHRGTCNRQGQSIRAESHQKPQEYKNLNHNQSAILLDKHINIHLACED